MHYSCEIRDIKSWDFLGLDTRNLSTGIRDSSLTLMDLTLANSGSGADDLGAKAGY